MIITNITQDNRYTSREPNPDLYEYEAGVLTMEQ
jgi:hypothetical protein